MRSIPKYLKETNIQDPWDDKQIETPKANPELKSRLEQISYRAIQAFACGTAEWLVYRFDKISDTKVVWDFIEVAWAMVIHVRYGKGAESWNYYSETEKKWNGPKPIQQALMYLESTFYTDETEPSIPASKLGTMVKAVLPNPSTYIEWQEKVLKKLETLYPRDEADLLGEVVPREVMDPDFDFQVEQTEELINKFLSKLAPEKNIFFNDLEGMKEIIEGEEEEEFKGTPFKFEIKQDKEIRQRED